MAYDSDCYMDGVTMASARTTAPYDAAYSARNITAVNNLVYQDAASPCFGGPFGLVLPVDHRQHGWHGARRYHPHR